MKHFKIITPRHSVVLANENRAVIAFPEDKVMEEVISMIVLLTKVGMGKLEIR